MELWYSLLYLLLASISLQFLQSVFNRNHRKLPPGPFPLPIIGNLLLLGTQPHKSLADLAKHYGPVLALKLGCLTTVVISSVPMAREVLHTNDAAFSNRFVPDAATVHDHLQSSVVFQSPSPKWRILRRICTSHVFANSRLEATRDIRRQKVQELLSHIKDCCENGKAVNIGQAAFTTTLNLVSNTFFSFDLASPDSETAREFKELIWGMMVEAGTPNIADFFPALKVLDPQGIRRRSTILGRKMMTLFNRIINERLELRKTTADSSHKNVDVLDSLLDISQGQEKEIQLSDIPHLLLDLFAAGTDTTSSTIEWAMAELICNPKKLIKAQDELQKVIGTGNSIKEVDINQLTYLHAIIKETLRLHPPVPFLVPRKSIREVELAGFQIPKGSQVLVNVWAMGRDPNVWEKPDLFEPE